MHLYTRFNCIPVVHDMTLTCPSISQCEEMHLTGKHFFRPLYPGMDGIYISQQVTGAETEIRLAIAYQSRNVVYT